MHPSIFMIWSIFKEQYVVHPDKDTRFTEVYQAKSQYLRQSNSFYFSALKTRTCILTMYWGKQKVLRSSLCIPHSTMLKKSFLESTEGWSRKENSGKLHSMEWNTPCWFLDPMPPPPKKNLELLVKVKAFSKFTSNFINSLKMGCIYPLPQVS